MVSGVHCKSHITTHGLALNCNTDLSWFRNIVPCGIKDKGVTTLSKELDQDVSIASVIPQFVSSFQNIFICKIEEMDSNDDQIVLSDANH